MRKLYSNIGRTTALREANEFEMEVASLAASEPFMKFLEERSKEKGTILLDEIEEQLRTGAKK